MRGRKPGDIWGDVPSADIAETTQAKRQAVPLCHVEHVHGNVINMTLPAGADVAAMLAQLGAKARREPTCGV